jgi:predicted MFS family arabinose efflux permease
MVFLVNLGRLVFAPLLQPVAADFGVTTASLGIVASAAWFGSALPRLPTGLVLTRVPRHHVILLTGTLLVVTSASAGLAGSVLHLTVGAFLMGTSSGMYFIAANPLVSELFPEGVGRALGIHGTSAQLAAVTGPVLLSLVLLVGDWRLVFGCIAVGAAAATLYLFWASRRTPLPDAGSADRSLQAAGRAQWPVVLTAIAVIGTVGFLWNGLFNLYGDYLEVVKGIAPETGRLLLSAMFVAGLPAFLFSGRLADRLPNVPLFLGVSAGFVVSVFALTLVDGILAILVVSLVLGYFAHSMIPVVDTYVLASFPDHHRASAYALYSASMMLVQSLGSGAVGLAVSRGSTYTATFRFLAVVVAAVVLGLSALYRAGRLPSGGTPGVTPSPTDPSVGE